MYFFQSNIVIVHAIPLNFKAQFEIWQENLKHVIFYLCNIPGKV